MWLEASRDLGIRVVSPFTLEAVRYPALVCDFGSANGMVILEVWDEAQAAVAQAHGYEYSCMDAGPYDRDEIVEALQERGWAKSPSDAPSWHCEAPHHDQG